MVNTDQTADLGFREVEWVADQLGLDKNTVYRYLNEGRLPGLQLGKKWLIEEQGLRDFLRREQRLQTDRRQAGTISAGLAAEAGPDGVLTVVFTDIVGGSELIERLGDDGWRDFSRAHDEMVWSALPGAGHTDVKSLGDGCMIAFASALEAVRFASRYACDLAERGAAGERVSVKIGVNTGPVTVSAADVTGRNVFIAALVGAAAQPGEVLVTAATAGALPEGSGVTLGEGRDLSLKVGGRVRAFPVSWEVSP